MDHVSKSVKTTALGRRALAELYNASQAPARRYEFVRDGDHVTARPIGDSRRLSFRKARP